MFLVQRRRPSATLSCMRTSILAGAVAALLLGAAAVAHASGLGLLGLAEADAQGPQLPVRPDSLHRLQPGALHVHPRPAEPAEPLLRRLRRGRGRPYYAVGALRAAPGVKRSLIGTVRRSNGRRQVTYNGWPLYTYVNEGPGVVRCQNIRTHGGVWLVQRASGRIVR